MNKEDRNRLSGIVLDASIEVHKQLGPGLLESVYEACLCKELDLRNINYKRQLSLPVNYKGFEINLDYRIDILVDNEIIVELKAAETLLPVHHAQLLTYLKLTDKRLGLLINFNVPRLVDGFKRVVNGYD
ncbi:MAG: GxxExxY protein [Calditrichaceae bacterium]|nr:GxxExxY protein [Calditrichia bacterium]NUQ43195.1 GxxExxY protein [Calditrichaceae bacterium]